MANNEYINKVEYGDQTLMDITDTTAESGDVIEGQVFYAKSGARSVGTLTDATTSTHGLMSAADKTKLDGITSGAAVTDIQINNISILSNGIANISPATASTLGLVQIDEACGIGYVKEVQNNVLVDTYKIAMIPAANSEIKAGSNTIKPIACDKFYRGVFFGLAKAAGDSTQAVSSNKIGTYTADAQTAIQTMLNVPSTAVVTTSSNGLMSSTDKQILELFNSLHLSIDSSGYIIQTINEEATNNA